MINDKLLLIYLNDHLAGSVLALELIERCRKDNPDGPLGEFLPRLSADIREDQDVVKELLDRLGSGEAHAKKAVAWLGEKAMRLKPQGEPFTYSDLDRLEDLEILVLGIRGKLALWTVLAEIAPADERLQGIDYDLLCKRAVDQHDQVEQFRREAARRAFMPED